MKKTYQKPAIKAHRVSVTNMICASPSIGFGSGSTDEMHAREMNFGFEEETLDIRTFNFDE